VEKFGIHWFRRDLRVEENPALQWNLERNRGNTLGIFFIDPKFLLGSDFSTHRFVFFLQTLKALKTELQEIGSDLLVFDLPPSDGFDLVLSKIKFSQLSCVTFNRDYEPYARDRDLQIEVKLEDLGIQVHLERDHLILEPRELQKDGKTPGIYHVFTPFLRKWFYLISQEDFQGRLTHSSEVIQQHQRWIKSKAKAPRSRLTWKQALSKNQVEDCLDSYLHKFLPSVTIPLPKAGSEVAYGVAQQFLPKLKNYLIDRDYPFKAGTSRLSIYFKNGSIVPSRVASLFDLKDANIEVKSGRAQFLKEIVWREFYYHILFHRPSVESESFLPQYNHLRWENREDWFEAWKEGRTGFPIVDAGMRELKTTGWMHNRVRMIVASFLTKDLLIDWKWGAKYFMNHLLDGDLAANNGGWQWAASTGCDPQPYFRIFSPLLQSKRFDPQGEYIKRYIPELRKVSASNIHLPGNQYIRPIVDHAIQREKALALFRKLK
jgi:deoxyribodipyrimidine photo-lyase